MAVDALGIPSYSSRHPRESDVQGNQLDLGNTGLAVSVGIGVGVGSGWVHAELNIVKAAITTTNQHRPKLASSDGMRSRYHQQVARDIIDCASHARQALGVEIGDYVPSCS